MKLLLLLLIPLLVQASCPKECSCNGGLIDCRNKGLTAIPEFTLSATEILLDNNNLRSLKKRSFNNCSQLNVLSVSGNRIHEIEENLLDAMSNLRTFNISNNRVKHVPQLASHEHYHLSSLDLSANFIINVHKNLINYFKNLKKLYLNKNRIQTLPNSFFHKHAGTKSITNIDISSNPWNCDCRIKKVISALSTSIDSHKTLGSFIPICYFPVEFRGRSSMDLSSLECSKPIVEQKNGEAVLMCPLPNEDRFLHHVVWLAQNGDDYENVEIGTFANLDGKNLVIDLNSGYDLNKVVCALNRRLNQEQKKRSKPRTNDFQLHFTFQQPPTSSRDGEPLELVCEASGNPTPKITWMFGINEVVESKKHKLLRAGRTLRIYPFLETDVGKYTCFAKNDKGTISHTTTVSLLQSEKPVIFDAPGDQNVEIGQSVTFRCNARGVPTPEIYWLFEGTRIPRRNTRFLISENNVELTIEKVTRHDAGQVTCQAVNSAGSSSAQAMLTVKDELTSQIDKILTDATIDDIAEKARINIESALKSTKNQNQIERIENPHDLKKLFRFAIPLKKVDLGKAREIYEESLRLIQNHIVNGLQFTSSMISPNVSYEAVLPAAYVQTLMEKSGCQTGQFVESCEDFCFYSKYRSYDGQCNNYEHPMWGVSEMAFLRLLPPRYENGFNTPVGWDTNKLYNGYKLPNPRKISRELIGTDDITPHGHLSAMTMQWGQFVDHDLTLTAPALTRHSYREGAFCNRTCDNVDPCFNIQLEPDDPKLHTGLYQKYPCMEFERNGAACGSGETSPIFQRVTYRDQLNLLTSYLDASGIYGNSEEQALELRDLFSDHGLMRFDIVSSANKPYLPFEKESDMDCRRNYSLENPINCFLAGDIRANEQLGLMSMHTIFMREHNRIAAQLLELNENWDGETIFQETRKIIGAILQHITYNDWLPKILGRATFNEIIGEYKGYNPDVNPTIANEFATAALRFAHTLINPHLYRLDKNFEEIKEGHLPLHNAFFAPERLVSEGGVDPLLRGLFAAPIKMPRPDQILNKELTERLFNKYHEVALDLAALNIQRGRDHGLPAWVEYRRFCNLSVPTNWNEMKSIVQNDTVITKLRDLYGMIDNIDLWVGGVTEKRTEEALMGPTFACIIADQFRRLRDGDRYWYENEGVFNKMQLRQIKKVTLAKIVCTNGDDIDRIQRDIFVYHGNGTNFYEKCDQLPEMNMNVWTTCCDPYCSMSHGSTVSEQSKKRKRNAHKNCYDDGEKKRSGDRWIHSNDSCVECMCEDGEVWCKTRDHCRK